MNQKELTRTDSTQHGTDTVVVACRAESLRLRDTMQYNLHHELQRIARDCNVAQRWSETRYEYNAERMR